MFSCPGVVEEPAWRDSLHLKSESSQSADVKLAIKLAARQVGRQPKAGAGARPVRASFDRAGLGGTRRGSMYRCVSRLDTCPCIGGSLFAVAVFQCRLHHATAAGMMAAHVMLFLHRAAGNHGALMTLQLEEQRRRLGPPVHVMTTSVFPAGSTAIAPTASAGRPARRTALR